MSFAKSLIAAGLHSSVVQALVRSDVRTGLTAAGTNLATALALVGDVNVISTAAASTGVALPVGDVGDEITVFNGGANACAVYVQTGQTINNAAASYSLVAGKGAKFMKVSDTVWVTVGA